MDERSRGRQNMGLEKLLYLRGLEQNLLIVLAKIHISEVDRQGILTCMLQEKTLWQGLPLMLLLQRRYRVMLG